MTKAADKNIMTIKEEDKNFIRSLLSLPYEKKCLIQGVLIGLDMKEKMKGA